MTLREIAVKNQLNYEKIKGRCTFKIQPAQSRGEIVDISVIIPVRGRTEFHKIVTEYFYAARENTKASIALTFVEHADGPPMHYWLSKHWVNHIFIPADGQPFNKCLCHNMGVLYGPRAHNYLFHDTDILVPGDFFNMLRENMQGYDAVQAFTRRRLILAGEGVTRLIINGDVAAGFHDRSNHEYKEAIPGAPGGSICVSWPMLQKVGFYEDCFFTGYSVEDQFFFNKLKLMGKLGFCDAPPIELIHLYHPSDHQLTTKEEDLAALDMYDELLDTEKRLYIKSRSDYFLKFIK